LNLKVCHLTSAHSSKDIRIFIKECRSLVDAGYEVHLIAPGAPNEKIDNVILHGINKNTSGRLKRFTATVRDVYKEALALDCDVYHFHDPELLPIGVLLKRKGKKVIYDVHEDVPRQILSKYWIPRPLRKIISSTFEKGENYAAKKFDALVTATPFINKRFSTQGIDAINVNNYPLMHELWKDNIKDSSAENNICFVGGITNIRGIREIISSMELVNGTLLLAGKFSSNEDKEWAEKQKGWKNVKDLGFVDRTEVAHILSISKAGLVLFHPEPNHVNALPNKMFEYMSSGLPVIASNFESWQKIIVDNNCGICVDPLKPDKIAEAIQWIFDNPSEAKIMGENGRKAIETMYNWETEKGKLIDLYEKIG